MNLRREQTVFIAPVLVVLFVLSGCGESTPPPGKGATVPTSSPSLPSLPPMPSPTSPTSPNSAGTAAANSGVSEADVAKALEKFEVKPDPEKYPQETPQKAMASLAKALEANDLSYQIAWLSTPEYTKRMIAKYTTIKACVEANQTPERVAGRKVLLDAIHQALKDNVTKEGVDAGSKWFAYCLPNNQIFEFELQPSKRWCWNPSARELKK